MHTSQQHSNSLLNQMRALRNRFLVITPSTPDSAWACRQAANAQQVVSRRWRQEGGGGGSKLGRHAPALPPTIATELTGLGAAHTAGNKRGCRENPLACPASSGPSAWPATHLGIAGHHGRVRMVLVRDVQLLQRGKQRLLIQGRHGVG